MSIADGKDMASGADRLPVMLSAIRHYAYCPRRCALIHVERQFARNLSTQRGND